MKYNMKLVPLMTSLAINSQSNFRLAAKTSKCYCNNVLANSFSN